MRGKFILTTAFFVSIILASVQTASAQFYLTDKGISDATLSPEEFEEKYSEPLDLDDIDPYLYYGTCGLVADSQEARDYVTYLLGPWNLEHQAGYFIVGGMTMPYQGSPKTDIINFERVNNNLILTHPEIATPLVFKWPNEDTWAWDDDALFADNPAPGISPEELEMVLDCSLDDMLRLIGRGTAVVDGIAMHFTYRIVATNATTITGIMHVEGVAQGYPFFSARTVTFNR